MTQEGLQRLDLEAHHAALVAAEFDADHVHRLAAAVLVDVAARLDLRPRVAFRFEFDDLEFDLNHATRKLL